MTLWSKAGAGGGLRLLATTCLALTVAACNPFDVGDIRPESSGGDGDRPDAATVPHAADAGGSPDDGGTSPDAQSACDPEVTAVGSGRHRAGEDCLASNCHGPGTGSRQFTAGGTLYDGPGSSTPLAGATIHLLGGSGQDITMVSQQNGNFYINQTISFPVTAVASRCPDTEPMVAEVTAGDASCNRSGCHDGGRPIYLP